MNLRFVEAFYWVASLKRISRAAEKLFLAQSVMSSRIATLEDELGVQLLDRRDKQFKLTAAGTRFLLYAHKLLDPGLVLAALFSGYITVWSFACRVYFMIGLILAGAALLTLAMGFVRLPRHLAEFIGALNLSPFMSMVMLIGFSSCWSVAHGGKGGIRFDSVWRLHCAGG